jgi:hypothetical protein
VQVTSYVAGAIPFTQILARLKSTTDLRDHGIGTVSASALKDVAGIGPVITAGVLDVAKGTIGPPANRRWVRSWSQCLREPRFFSRASPPVASTGDCARRTRSRRRAHPHTQPDPRPRRSGRRRGRPHTDARQAPRRQPARRHSQHCFGPPTQPHYRPYHPGARHGPNGSGTGPTGMDAITAGRDTKVEIRWYLSECAHGGPRKGWASTR